MLIGLIGESPNDTQALQYLLTQKYNKFKFRELIRNITGDNLNYIYENEKLKKLLDAELKGKKYEIIIYTRDLDDLETDKASIRHKKKIFNELNKLIKNTGIFLLNIYEIEALIWSDIESINKHYGVNINFSGDSMAIKEPKEELQKYLNWFSVNDTPKIFKILEINKVIANCRYFNKFITDFDKQLVSLKPIIVKGKKKKPKKRN